MNKEPKIKPRRMAMIGKVLAIQVEPGTEIFHPRTGDRLGIVGDRQPVYNYDDNAVYLSTDDWLAAKAALPKAEKKTLPGLPGGSVH
jgi:hypothetical protein